MSATNAKEPIAINDDFADEDSSRYIKSFMFVKGFAVALDLQQTLIALAIARKMHCGQTRKDGTPYISHPLKVCSTLINYGVKDDVTLAAALLHDVVEDCKDKLPFGGKELITEYGIDPEVYRIILLLSKDSGLNDYELSVYFNEIKKDYRAVRVQARQAAQVHPRDRDVHPAHGVLREVPLPMVDEHLQHPEDQHLLAQPQHADYRRDVRRTDCGAHEAVKRDGHAYAQAERRAPHDGKRRKHNHVTAMTRTVRRYGRTVPL